eukprot:365900-Chlamydomonas_euryale.AAC.3
MFRCGNAAWPPRPCVQVVWACGLWIVGCSSQPVAHSHVVQRERFENCKAGLTPCHPCSLVLTRCAQKPYEVLAHDESHGRAGDSRTGGQLPAQQRSAPERSGNVRDAPQQSHGTTARLP